MRLSSSMSGLITSTCDGESSPQRGNAQQRRSSDLDHAQIGFEHADVGLDVDLSTSRKTVSPACTRSPAVRSSSVIDAAERRPENHRALEIQLEPRDVGPRRRQAAAHLHQLAAVGAVAHGLHAQLQLAIQPLLVGDLALALERFNSAVLSVRRFGALAVVALFLDGELPQPWR